MQVHYIFHSGFLVELKDCSLIFDYYKGALPPVAKDKPVFVFVSHGHPDHYNPEIFAILKKSGINDIIAVLSNDISKLRRPFGVETIIAHADKSFNLPLSITVTPLISTDRGVAYLVETPEGTIYHAGDLNDWVWDGEPEKENKQMTGMFRHETDKLNGKQIDVAFLALDPRLEKHYADGMKYFMENVGARNVYPMHYWSQPEIIKRFIDENPQYSSFVKNPEI